MKIKSCGIVVLYNPSKEEIKNLALYNGLVDYLLVLDNSESDNEDKVRKIVNLKLDNNLYIHFSNNIGLCAALNYGANYARKIGCNWILLMDGDSKPINKITDIYSKYLNSHETKNIAVLSPVHLFDRSSAKGYDGEKEKKWAMTSGCFYNLDIFYSLGCFKEELFVECLDLDYCYRALENGYLIIECGNALLDHKPGISIDFKILDKCIFKYGYASPWRYYMQCRSLIWLSLRYKHIETVIMYIWRYFKVIFFFDNKKSFLKEMHVGTKDGIKMYMEYKKKHISSSNKQ